MNRLLLVPILLLLPATLLAQPVPGAPPAEAEPVAPPLHFRLLRCAVA